ncbi:MAG: UDP-glucose 4-epimerase GalE [Planctomycetia bacterium]|nr:UDP-glucose 4-epimerase GalE [Planctomycetia bacterium]
MNILVTGGAGYIGSVTVEKLVEAGYDVVVFDNLYQGHRQAVHPKAVLVVGDLANPVAIDEVMKKYQPAAVMHFAAYSLVGESVANPMKYMGENATNAANLLRSMLNNNVSKFILSSTANLFDKPQNIPITEAEAIIPGSPYGESKAIIERFLYWLDRHLQFRYTALRYFNAAGASKERGEDHSPECHLIPLVLEVAQGKREKIFINGDNYPTPDGTCVRDYIHVADLAQAHILALENMLRGGASDCYNLGNGEGYSVLDVIETVRKVTGHPIPTEIAPPRAGDPATLIAGSDKIRAELGWKPQFPALREIIQSAWDWRQNFPNGYEN